MNEQKNSDTLYETLYDALYALRRGTTKPFAVVKTLDDMPEIEFIDENQKNDFARLYIITLFQTKCTEDEAEFSLAEYGYIEGLNIEGKNSIGNREKAYYNFALKNNKLFEGNVLSASSINGTLRKKHLKILEGLDKKIREEANYSKEGKLKLVDIVVKRFEQPECYDKATGTLILPRLGHLSEYASPSMNPHRSLSHIATNRIFLPFNHLINSASKKIKKFKEALYNYNPIIRNKRILKSMKKLCILRPAIVVILIGFFTIKIFFPISGNSVVSNNSASSEEPLKNRNGSHSDYSPDYNKNGLYYNKNGSHSD